MELRKAISTNISKKNIHYSYPGKLKEIIFGCRSIYEDIIIVINIVKELNPEIIISRMFLGENSFKLEKISLGDNNIIPESWRKINKM